MVGAARGADQCWSGVGFYAAVGDVLAEGPGFPGANGCWLA